MKERRGKHIYYAIADQHVRELLTNTFDHVEEERLARQERNDPRLIVKFTRATMFTVQAAVTQLSNMGHGDTFMTVICTIPTRVT